ncbi:MAG: hypothetical protein HXX20_05320 [Chloroflexi bacterium]|nr:hypothetical protein [Chloroflexota bacterium]
MNNEVENNKVDNNEARGSKTKNSKAENNKAENNKAEDSKAENNKAKDSKAENSKAKSSEAENKDDKDPSLDKLLRLDVPDLVSSQNWPKHLKLGLEPVYLPELIPLTKDFPYIFRIIRPATIPALTVHLADNTPAPYTTATAIVIVTKG